MPFLNCDTACNFSIPAFSEYRTVQRLQHAGRNGFCEESGIFGDHFGGSAGSQTLLATLAVEQKARAEERELSQNTERNSTAAATGTLCTLCSYLKFYSVAFKT